jgi:hypothetical protein
MTCSGRRFGILAVLVSGVLLTGCLGQEPGRLPVSKDTPFELNVPETGIRTTARAQRPDFDGASPAPVEPLQVTQAQGVPLPPGSKSSGIQPVVNLTHSAPVPASVRVIAWVNHKPIFQDEVMNIVMPQIRRLPPASREAEQVKLFNKGLETLIDSELLMQDALRQLEKNEKFLEKLKKDASKECDKQIHSQMRQQEMATIEEFKQLLQSQGTTLASVRRMLERQFIADEFTKVKVYTKINKIGNENIRDYYQNHINEFMQVDRVKWQDIFIAVGPKHPTVLDARNFAHEVGRRWTGGEDIAKLLQFDDGQGANLKGAGVGEIRGDIRPAELEKYLFAMKEGEFGFFELTTGVHLFRLIKREQAGPMPFDDKLQVMIGNKLKNEVFDQERRSLIRDLREQAVIEIDQGH